MRLFPSSWAPKPILERVDREAKPIVAGLLFRSDNIGLLYPGKVIAINAEPEGCKGWVALLAAKTVIRAGGSVAYVDLETDATTILERLRDLSLTDAEMSRFFYVSPDEAALRDADALDELVALAPTLIVVDSVNEALAIEGIDARDNTEVTWWLRNVPRRLADLGATVLLLDHVAKNRDTRGTWAIGAQAKRAGIDATFSIVMRHPFGIGLTGRGTITVTKDRFGRLRQHAAGGSKIGELVLESFPDGGVEIGIDPPGDTAGPFRPTGYMERLSKVLEVTPEPTSRDETLALLAGKAGPKSGALACLVAEGYVAKVPEGRKVLYRSVRAFREGP